MTIQEEIEKTATSLGMSAREIDGAIRKHSGDLKGYLRTLKDRRRKADKDFEKLHNDRWYEQERIKADAVHTEAKNEAYTELLQRRAKSSLAQRLQSCFAYLELTDTRAGTTSFADATSSGTMDSKIPTGLGDKPLINTEPHVTIITRHLEQLEAKVDAARGLRRPIVDSPAERIRLLDSLVGVHSKDVARDFPELGSQRTIENWRAELGRERNAPVRPSTGLPKDDYVGQAE